MSYPELNGRLNGIAVRVPLLNASLTGCVFEVKRPTGLRRPDGGACTQGRPDVADQGVGSWKLGGKRPPCRRARQVNEFHRLKSGAKKPEELLHLPHKAAGVACRMSP
jgi:hypothetical protein